MILTGVLVAVVLVIVIGGTALCFQNLGWLPQHETPFTIPNWMGAWFERYSTWETLGAQALAAAFVVGSYFAAERLLGTRSRREGRRVAVISEAPPQDPVARRPDDLLTYLTYSTH